MILSFETFVKVPRALVIFVFVDFGVSSLLWTNRVGGDAVGSYRILSIVMRPDWPIRGRHCQFYWWPLGSREHSRIISFCVFSIFDDKTKTIFRESRLRRKKKEKYGNWRGRVKINRLTCRDRKNIKMEIVEPMSPESVNRLCKESLQKKCHRKKS